MTANTPFRPDHQTDQLIGDISGLNAGDTEPARGLADIMNVGGFGKQALKQRIKATPAVFAPLAPRAQVDAGEDDLANAFARKGEALGDDRLSRAAGSSPTSNVHNAIRACVIASVLYLHTYARSKAISDRKRRRPVADRPNQAVEHIIDLQLSGNMHSSRIHRGERIRINGGGAARYHHIRAGIGAQNLPDGLARFLFRLPGDGARVDYHHIGGIGTSFQTAARKQTGGERIGFHSIHLAPEIDDGEVHARSPAPMPPIS